MNDTVKKILFCAACVLLPIIWGVLVNWVFDLWHKRNSDNGNDEPIFPDYQI